ncbi:(4Fe-4S)-binding protein [Sphingobacterium bovistauri]|uniref:(4Fe-4S)-binding protein n=1 Tax=Sphingobacterium bovistauri TaxID=2781959 RepID=A0ABS7Z576_9SPHI|nr:(4Fe-4S)-binding protein [Sphingobacterium bovistauri]MCA5005163.1 (4Fe-4S)-binding protein [Sphingobacterium bovistauri]
MSETTIKYPHPNGEITVLWKPKLCIHAGVCVRLLPMVYKPKDRPWCNPENASTEDLINQINQCPSGALGYERNK